MGELLGSSNDDFIRTTEERHRKASQEIWRRMLEAGDIYKGSYAGWYSVRDEAYYAEDETRLTDDSKRLGPQGTPVEWVEEESYFFRLHSSPNACSPTTRHIPTSSVLLSDATRSSRSSVPA